MVNTFETTSTAGRAGRRNLLGESVLTVAEVLGDDWVEVEPGIYVQSGAGQSAPAPARASSSSSHLSPLR
jgi:hypothetical protein